MVSTICSSRAFVNGVLRNVARNKAAITFPDREKDLAVALSVIYSMPEHLVRLLLTQYGEEDTEATPIILADMYFTK